MMESDLRRGSAQVRRRPVAGIRRVAPEVFDFPDVGAELLSGYTGAGLTALLKLAVLWYRIAGL